MKEAIAIIIAALNVANAPYNNKLTVAIELSGTKKQFVEIADRLNILEDLQDACEELDGGFDGWLVAFGILDMEK